MTPAAEDIATSLEDKRVKLEAELALMSAPPESAGGISFGKRVGEGTSMAIERIEQVALHDDMQVLLKDVERALAKLDEGTYGECDVCGAEIPPERLEILPWAVLCVRDAAKK
ncbi:MAG: TraR/DksA family transcriptional regulator [Actinomycetota bacterium]|nr:TraR/DksA C4-type zinc finger protein [Actinomycetota bacterium]